MKKLNLIKRLWTDSHEKQKMGGMRRYAAMLMMLLTLGVGQMWADWTFSGGTMYFDNSQTNWTDSHICLLIGKSSYTTVYEMTAVPGTTLYKCSLPNNQWSDAEYMAVVGTSTLWGSGSWGTSNLSNATHRTGTYTGGHSGNSSYIITPSSSSNDCSITKTDFTNEYRYVHPDILNDAKVMIYCGELTGWRSSNYQFEDKSGNVMANVSISGTTSICGDNYAIGYVALPATIYYNQGHWDSGLECAVQAGYLYVVRGEKTGTYASYFTQKEESTNYLYEVSRNVDNDATRTTSTSITSSIIAGQGNMTITNSGSAGYSVLGNSNSFYYYFYDGSSWSYLTNTTGAVDFSSLAAGTGYKIATIISDGNIYVKGDEDEFDVYDTWAMYSGDTKIADFTTTDGVHYSITDLVINNDNNANTNYRSSCNPNPAQAGADPLLVNEASARTLVFDNGRIDWKDGNGTFNIYIVNNEGWKIYASKTAGVEEWYWIAGNGAENGRESVTKQSMELTAVSGVYSCTRTLTQNQTFHFGNTIKGYWPKTPAQSNHTNVTATSSDIQLAGGGSTYWFQFTPADQPVVMTLNTTTDPYTISFSNPVYTITYQDQGGSAYSGSNGSALPTSHTYGTATALVNGEKSGYRFVGWFTDASCTESAGSSIGATAYSDDITLYAKWGENPSLTGLALSTDLVTTGNTFTATPTIDAGDGRTTIVCWEVQTAAGVKLDPQPSISPEEGNAVTITAPTTPGSYKVVATLREGSECEGTVLDTEEQSFTVEGIYTVTITDGTGSSSVNAGSVTHPSITASTVFGATFDHWEVDGGADVASKTSSTTTVSATSAGTVTAVYVQNMWVYIQGRFEAYTDKTKQTLVRTGTNSGDKYWNTSSTALKMDYNPSTHVYYLHTYKYPSELKQYDNDAKFYISLKTSSSSSGLSDVTEYFANSASTIDAADTKIDFSATPGSSIRPYINNATNDKYLVLYWDGTKMWYEEESIMAAINEVNLSVSRVPPTAPITATPTMYVRGVVDKAYCWGVYTDEDCTSKVNSVSFTSLGDGKVQFMAPQEQGTYYLKLTVHSTDDCNATIDDEEVVSFTVTTDDMVFFKNVPGWGNVHVYFLGTSDYWDANLGSGCAGRDNGTAHGMTRIGNSDVYYYDYHGNSNVVFDGDGKAYIAFTDNYKPNSNNFSECQAVFRGDFSECAAMYVPENWITHYLNNAAYYNRGYWTNYMSASSGFSFYLWDKTADSAPGEIEIVSGAALTGTIGNNTYVYEYDFANENNHKNNLPYTYGFKIKGCGGSWYGAADDMTITKCTDWNLGTDTRKCGISVNAPLPHKFIFTLAGDGHVQVSVEYPVNVGDYRLLYNDDTQDHPHPSQYIRQRANGKDTVAMFIRPSAEENLKVQYCTGIDGETITWEDYAWNGGSAAINVSGKADGVYVFYLEQDGSGNLTVNTSETKSYSGKYYIRTNCLDGGWNSYKSSDDNLMTYAQYPEDKNYGFNYYKAKWVGATGTDVTYTIACDYSPSLCDTLTADPGNYPLSASEAASLPHTANIRFGWHSKTNQLKREYINGSTNVSDRFLVMMGDAKLKDKDGNALAISGLNANEISFTDLNNWIYRCDIQAQTGAAVKLQATYDGHEQYFIGGAGVDQTEEIIGGSSGEWYGMRVTYDFKTNRLMTAWLPSGNEVESNVVLNADMMLIRKGQNAATQVYFGESNKDKSISNIHRIYGVLEFQYDSIAGKFSSWSSPNAYKYLMYYLSFPFDVKVSEIFGCGVRGKNWIIQKYNGAKRAQIGWFAETSTFWETLPGDSTLHANEGYLLILDRISFNDASSSLWYKQGSGNSIYLYFPSTSATSGTIKDNNEEVTINIPSHTCNIERPFTPDIDGWSGGELVHSNTDSHWNVFGIPLFQSKAATTVGDSELKYFYSWNYTDNTLRPKVTLAGDTVFKSMHGYMVQFAGDVTFTGAHISASVAARRMPSNKHYLAELQLVNENGDENATYVELREKANTDFQLNEDMYMMRSSNTVDLYSFAGAYDVAANVLPIDDQLVRVGVDVKRAGTYRFTMPSEFSGTVTLIDNLMGTRTNMALGDHEVYLERGVDNNRFLLEININKMPTAIDGVDGGSLKDGKAHKFIENGQMYILQNGIIYDAQGKRVK